METFFSLFDVEIKILVHLETKSLFQLTQVNHHFAALLAEEDFWHQRYLEKYAYNWLLHRPFGWSFFRWDSLLERYDLANDSHLGENINSLRHYPLRGLENILTPVRCAYLAVEEDNPAMFQYYIERSSNDELEKIIEMVNMLAGKEYLAIVYPYYRERGGSFDYFQWLVTPLTTPFTEEKRQHLFQFYPSDDTLSYFQIETAEANSPAYLKLKLDLNLEKNINYNCFFELDEEDLDTFQVTHSYYYYLLRKQSRLKVNPSKEIVSIEELTSRPEEIYRKMEKYREQFSPIATTTLLEKRALPPKESISK